MNRWPFMPGNAQRAVGICFEGDGLHWVEVHWPRRQLPVVTRQGVCARPARHARREWLALWQQSGVQARRTGLALSEQSVVRIRVSLPSAMREREKWFLLEQTMQSQLPWPLAETAWDCQLSEPPAMGSEPTQPKDLWVEVVATPKAEVRNSRQWCVRAGLRLTRLEPLSQARERGERWQHVWPNAALSAHAAGHAASQVALGLALGAVQS